MTEPDPLAALDFTPSMCEYVKCSTDAISAIKFTCGCPPWRVCPDHADYWRSSLRQVSYGYCRTHRCACIVTMEEA